MMRMQLGIRAIIILMVKRWSLVVGIVTTLKLNGVVLGRVYSVGEEEGWSSQTDYASWATRYNFTVADVLVFNYVKEEHNVYEVREEVFRWCNANGSSDGVLGKYHSGQDQVLLSKPKSYWFICNIAGHCLGGMRFGIQVKQRLKIPISTIIDNNNHNSPLTPLTQPPNNNLSHDNSSALYPSQPTSLNAYFVPFGLLIFNLYIIVLY